MRALATTLLVLLGCKGSSAPAPKPAECPKADTDPDFVHVDRDQLAAMCVSSRLPETAFPSDHAALVLPDGTRAPWLLVWSTTEEQAIQRSIPRPDAWVKSTREYLERRQHLDDSPPAKEKRSGKQWLNVLCPGDEVYTTVITAALFDKAGPHAVAIRGTQVLDEALPAGSTDAAVFAKAIELTTKLTGGPVKLASHSLASTPPMELDVAGPWRSALSLRE